MIQYSTKEFIKVLNKNGYKLLRGKGDHGVFVNKEGKHISIPISKKDLCLPLCKRLIKENGLIVN